jgi:hypothetical protein
MLGGNLNPRPGKVIYERPAGARIFQSSFDLLPCSIFAINHATWICEQLRQPIWFTI